MIRGARARSRVARDLKFPKPIVLSKVHIKYYYLRYNLRQNYYFRSLLATFWIDKCFLGSQGNKNQKV